LTSCFQPRSSSPRFRSGTARSAPVCAASIAMSCALALGARDGKVVLGEAQHRDFPIMPSPGQRIAVGQGANIRSLNVYNDPDDIVRRIPLHVVIDHQSIPSMAVELAARALGATPDTLSGSRIPSQV